MYRLVFLFVLLIAFEGLAQSKNASLDRIKNSFEERTCSSIIPLSEDVIKKNSELSLFWIYKGRCEMQINDYETAIISLKKSKELSEKQTYFIDYLLAECYVELNDIDKAVSSIENSLKNGGATILFKNEKFNKLRELPEFNALIEKYDPSLNKWTSIFLLIAFHGLILSLILFFRKKGNKKANAFLGSFILSFVLTLIAFVIYWSGYINVSPFNYTHLLYISFSYLFGPLLYLYIKSLNKDVVYRRDIFHFSFFTVSLILYILGAYIKTTDSLFTSFRGFYYNPWVRISQFILYAILIYRYINRMKYSVADNVYSWLKKILYAFAGLIVAYITYFTLINFSFFNIKWDYMISFEISFFILLISVMGYVYPEIFWGFKLKEVLPFVKYKKSGLSKSLSLELKSKLIRLMVDEQLYKDNDLNLERLSKKLETTKHNTSQVINEHFNENFYEFLNAFRIDEAKELLIHNEKEDLNITQILYEVGFNNKVSFNNAFKKRTGLTPSQFRKKTLKVV